MFNMLGQTNLHRNLHLIAGVHHPCIRRSAKPFSRALLGPKSAIPISTYSPYTTHALKRRNLYTASSVEDDPKNVETSSTIYPWDTRFQAWSTLATAAAAATGFIIPLEVALGGGAHAYDFANNALVGMDLSLVVIFAADMFVRSRVATFDAETGITDDPEEIRKQYISSPDFVYDLLGCLPLDYMALAALGGVAHIDPAALGMLPALKLLHLVRLYRVNNLVTYFLFNLNVPLLWVTVFRNLAIVLVMTHWVACGFLWEARECGFDPEILLGVNPELMATLNPRDQYETAL